VSYASAEEITIQNAYIEKLINEIYGPQKQEQIRGSFWQSS
jgi:hypothetical protein